MSGGEPPQGSRGASPVQELAGKAGHGSAGVSPVPEQAGPPGHGQDAHATVGRHSKPSVAGEIVTALVALALGVVAFLAIRPAVVVVLAYPYQIDREEGFLVNQAARLVAGETIYPPLTDYPYLVGNYTPLYPAVSALMGLLSPSQIGACRLLTLVSALVAMALVALVTLRFTHSIAAAALGAAIFPATYDVAHWLPFARVDFMAAALGVAGMAVFLLAPRRAGLIAAALLFAAAFHTRQTQLFAPAAVLAVLMMERRWRDAAILGAVSAGVALLAVAALSIVTGGEFWRHTVTYNANEFDWWQLRRWMVHLWFFQRWLLLALPVAGVVLWLARPLASAPENRAAALAIVYTLLTAISLVAIAKRGAAANYFIEFHIACALMAGLAVGFGIRRLRGGVPPRIGVVLALLAMLLALHAWRLCSPSFLPILAPRPPTAADAEAAAQIAVRIADADGPVISEDVQALLLARRPVIYQSFIMAQLANEGKWDPAPFLADVAARRFALIVTEKPIKEEFYFGFTGEMRDAILASYELEGSMPAYSIGGRSARFFYFPRR